MARFPLGTKWDYPAGDQRFRTYLRVAARRPGFFLYSLAALAFAAGAWKSLGAVGAVALFFGIYVVIIPVGYMVWRRGPRS